MKTRPIYECRCDERLKTKVEESTLLTYTGLLVELEHLKIKTTLIDEMFASVMCGDDTNLDANKCEHFNNSRTVQRKKIKKSGETLPRNALEDSTSRKDAQVLSRKE